MDENVSCPATERGKACVYRAGHDLTVFPHRFEAEIEPWEVTVKQRAEALAEALEQVPDRVIHFAVEDSRRSMLVLVREMTKRLTRADLAAVPLGEVTGDLSAPTPVSMLVPGVDGGTVHTVTGRAHSALRVRLIRAHSQFTQDGVRTVVYSDMAFYYATGQPFDQAEKLTLERAASLKFELVDRCVSGAGVALTFVTPE